MAQQTFFYEKPFVLESGRTINGYHLAYHTYGNLCAAGDNVVWFFHALTANSNVEEWWAGLIGEGKLIDPANYFIVCVNMPGSCYGSFGPLDNSFGEDQASYHDFPFFTTRDMIRAYEPLKDFLEIRKIHIGIGGSMGGQQLLEWAIEEPELFEYIIPIATNASHSPWAQAFNASQRWCIEADATWKERHPNAGIEGMKIARSIAVLSYRHYDTYDIYQKDSNIDLTENYRSESYQKYQGYQTANSITNKGSEEWNEKTGMPCIWMLDMFNPSAKTVIVVPYKTEVADKASKVATTDYFGEIPSDRIKYNNGVLLFKADGKKRGKLGINPTRAKPVAGSYDAENKILTITMFDVDPAGKYLNQEWNTKKPPFSGDAVNAYNDGPLEDGSQMGPFFEIESVSPAAFLKPGASLSHKHAVFHFTGDEQGLDKIARKVLGISLEDIKKAF